MGLDNKTLALSYLGTFVLVVCIVYFLLGTEYLLPAILAQSIEQLSVFVLLGTRRGILRGGEIGRPCASGG
jgi:hypothetical protein